MPEAQPLSSIVPLAAIVRPACPQCHAQMTLARIMPAFVGTALHRFECTVCNHVLEALGAHDDRRGTRLARRGEQISLSILAADPFAPYGQERRHDHGAEEKAKQSERLHAADNSDQHQQEG